MPTQPRTHISIHIRLTCFALRGRFTLGGMISATGVSDKTVMNFLRSAQDVGLCRVVGVAPKPVGKAGPAPFLYEFSNSFPTGEELT